MSKSIPAAASSAIQEASGADIRGVADTGLSVLAVRDSSRDLDYEIGSPDQTGLRELTRALFTSVPKSLTAITPLLASLTGTLEWSERRFGRNGLVTHGLSALRYFGRGTTRG